ncbi:MAG: DUF3375 domain-containing protein [Kineosporiaceae bacterium]|nr:DUF3375 domain-containing protein [Kineosporiaceae bacterium]
MSEIAGELARVSLAFDQPTLTLLHRKYARVVVTILRSAFSRDVTTVPAARLHAQVDSYLDDLRGIPGAEVPAGSGRDLCQAWMRDQWLVYSVDESGAETYTLTSHAQDALGWVTGMTRERASLSEHRIATILDTVRRFNAEANPDRWVRMSILEAEIERLRAEHDRLLDGGDVQTVTPDYMLEGFSEVLSLVDALPADFLRVEEAFATLRTQILASFRQEERPAGEVVDAYLERAESLMTATAEGRAFEGAFALLRDDLRLRQLHEHFADLLAHPLAEEILTDADRSSLRGTEQLIRRGMESVLNQRSRVTRTLREYITTHNAARDRELDATLRQLDSELTQWLDATGPRANVTLPLLPERVDVEHLKERFYNPRDDAAPKQLRDVSDQRPESTTLEQLRALGGPSMRELRRVFDAAACDELAAATLGELFASLDEALRRPVEILGLLQLATNAAGLGERVGVETFATVRADGTRRDLVVPAIPTRSPATAEAAGPEVRTLPRTDDGTQIDTNDSTDSAARTGGR